MNKLYVNKIQDEFSKTIFGVRLYMSLSMVIFLYQKQSTTATSRHRCDMTSDVFKKATLNPNKQTSDTHNKMADDQKKEIHFVLISNVYW